MRKNDENLIAVIRSSLPPTEDEKRRLSEYLKKVRGIEVPVTWEEDGSITDGFQMEVGSDIYDWTISGRLRQFKESLDKLNPAGGNIIPLIRETVQNWTPEVSAEEMGEVLSVGDEIATVIRPGTRGLRRNPSVLKRRQRHGPGPDPRPDRLHPLR